MRRGLDGAIEHYNRAVGSLEARVLPQARKFKELGAGGEEDIPNLEMLDRLPRQLSLAVVPPELDGTDESEAVDDPALPAELPTDLRKKVG
jgi:DNA recombination protein RmuC